MNPDTEAACCKSDHLAHEARQLLNGAGAAVEQKAEEFRSKGVELYGKAATLSQRTQAAAVQRGKMLAESAEDTVKSNPWKALALTGAVGVAIGLLIGRK